MSKRFSLNTFIEKSRKIHGFKYSYGKVEYYNAHIKVLITCFEHGDFPQTPLQHFRGQGCPICGEEKRRLLHLGTTERFIMSARDVHGDKYDYSRTIYQKAKIEVTIACPEHGKFTQQPQHHLAGCGRYGFDESRPGFIYLLESTPRGLAKIGITNNPKQRFTQLRKATPFSFDVVNVAERPGAKARKIETQIKRLGETANLCGFSGATEWFTNALEIGRVFKEKLYFTG